MGPRSIFVQDFVAVDRPFERVLTVVRGALREPLLSAMVFEAWSSQSAAATTAPPWGDRDAGDPTDGSGSLVSVNVSSPRTRDSCLIVPVRWTVAGDQVLLDADLEFVRFGIERTHVSLTGRAPAEIVHWRRDDVSDRLLLAVVRHFLVAVSVALEAAVDGSPTDHDGAPLTGHDAMVASRASRAAMMGA